MTVAAVAARPRPIEIEGVRYPEWNGRRWGQQIAGPINTDEPARRWLQPAA